jgi:hypothetical protein
MSEGTVTAESNQQQPSGAPAVPTENTSSAPAPILTGGVGQNATPTWRDGLPAELKNDPNIAKFNDPASLAKSYVEAQKLIGKKAVELPNEAWKPEQWNDLFDKLGRPKSPADYKFNTEIIPEGRRDEAMEKYFAEKMHTNGLTQKQAEELHKEFIGFNMQREQAIQQEIAKKNEVAMTQLKQEWGDAFNAKADAAFRAAKEFGGQELAQVLQETGLGNHPVMVKMFAKIGEKISEDTALGRNSSDSFVDSPSTALAEIDALKMDKDFMAAFNNRGNPGHKSAVAKWNKLHNLAYSANSPI